ncbi:MAG: hypothetical protein J6J23_00670 [Clostridia bacterium]|nr:hypothetical protein [Clostridia bacterium]
MKSKKKIFSIILAFVMAVGVLGAPSLAYKKASADSQNVNTILMNNSTLNVNYNSFNQAFNVTDNNIVQFKNFLTNYTTNDVYVSLWAPDGNQLLNFVRVEDETSYSFTQPGLYAVMFKKDGGDELPSIFSRQYYIAVENSIEEIVLTETVSETAKTGSYVEIPECETTNVTIKVFSPYGENVPYNSGKFTNINNVLGTYYIEYSKTIEVNGEDVKQYKYVNVKFGDNYGNPTTSEIKKDEAKKEDNYILSEELKEVEDKGIIYLFKSYWLAGVQVKNVHGEFVNLQDVEDATLTVKMVKNIDGTETVYYYDLSNTGEQTTEETSVILSEIMNSDSLSFIARDLEGISSISDSGAKYEIIYKSESLDFEKTITANSKIDAGAYVFECKKVFKDIILVNPEDELSEENDINVFTLPKCEPTVNGAFSHDDYMGFLDNEGVQVEVYFTDSNGNKVEFDEAGEGVEYVITKNADSYSIDFSKLSEKAKKGSFSYELVVNYSIGYEISDTITGTLTKSYKSHLATEYNDDRKPTGIKIDEYKNIIYVDSGDTAPFTFPNASASDVDNKGNKTNGVDISIEYKQTNALYNIAPNDGGQLHFANVGETVNLSIGTYIVTYKFADSAGNTRSQSFYIKVCEETKNDLDSDFINVSGARASFDEASNTYTFSFENVNVITALVYKEDAELSSPKSISVVNGRINELEVVSDENFVVVLSGRSLVSEIFMALAVDGKHIVESVKPYSYNMSSKPSVLVANEYASLTAKVGDRILFLQESASGFSVETENGKYVIEDRNEIVINYPGRYVITNNDTGIKTTVTAYEATVSDVSYFLNMKQVVSSKDTEGERTVEIRAPYVKGYFGHSMVANVTTSDGLTVATKDGKFVVTKTDNYKVEFLFSYLSGTKEVTNTVSSGTIVKPTITIASTYENIIWTGEANRVYLIDATAVDKFGKSLTNITTKVYDKFGKAVEIKYDAENKAYVEVAEAGIYSVYYSAVDEDGFSAISQVNFMILYDESENNDGLSAWAIVGIVVGSLLVVGAIAWLIVVVVLKKKGKEKFINKARQAKKEKKASDEKEYTSVLYTIVQSKNEAEWTIKKNNRVIAKTSTKEEAISKINEDGDGQKKIKVYNKQGRLIDSID